MVTECYLGLGSNIGNREQYLLDSIFLLKSHKEIIVKDVSSFYETEPYGYIKQEKFLNAVILIQTSLEPEELLKVNNSIEKELDRKRIIRWGPRTIDIDILLYGNEEVNQDNLIIPHKELFKRAFVLVPLCEIYKKNLYYNSILKQALQINKDKNTVTCFKDRKEFLTIIK